MCALAGGVNQNEISQVYHGFEIAKALGNCQVITADAVVGTVKAVLKKEGNTAQNIYLALSVADNAGLKVNQEEVAKALAGAITKDDGILRLAFWSSNLYKDHLRDKM